MEMQKERNDISSIVQLEEVLWGVIIRGKRDDSNSIFLYLRMTCARTVLDVTKGGKIQS